MNEISILTIHGVGSQERGFSEEFQGKVTEMLQQKPDNFIWQEIYWADKLIKRENHLWDSMEKAMLENGRRFPLDWRSAWEFVVHNIGDALAYNRGQ